MLWPLSCGVALAGVRLETGVGVDTNVRRVEEADGQADMVYRLVLDAEGGFRPSRRSRLGLGYQAGARHFQTIAAEDALFQRFNANFSLLAASRLSLGLTANANDRTTRDPRQPRDYTRVAAGPRLDLRLGDWVLSVQGSGEHLYFKPDDAFTATAVGGEGSVTWRLDEWSLGARAGWLARDFHGTRLVRIGAGANRAPILVPADRRREDTVLHSGANLRYVGQWLGEIQYLLVQNDSNTYGGTFTRHQISLSGTAQAPLGLVVSAKVGLLRNAYADGQFIELGGRIEDEGRSSLAVRVERPLGVGWSAVLTTGWWFSPADAGPDYQRQSAVLGLAFNDVDD